MKSPIEQLDKLVRYLINNYGDAVKVDDISNEDAVDEAIKILEQQRHLASRSSRAAYDCEKFGHLYYWRDDACIYCGAQKPPPA